MPAVATIRIPGLQKLDVLEMPEAFPAGAVAFTDEKMTGGRHGELVTTAVVVLTALSLKALAAWLLKSRTSKRITKTIEIVDASGARRIETLNVDVSSSSAPESEVLKALATLTSFDVTKLLDSAGS